MRAGRADRHLMHIHVVCGNSFISACARHSCPGMLCNRHVTLYGFVDLRQQHKRVACSSVSWDLQITSAPRLCRPSMWCRHSLVFLWGVPKSAHAVLHSREWLHRAGVPSTRQRVHGLSCVCVHVQANNVLARPASAARGPAEALAA